MVNRIATWGSILLIMLGGGIWAGEIQNEQQHKADVAQVARIESDVQHIKEDITEVKDDIDDIKDGQQEILDAIRNAN